MKAQGNPRPGRAGRHPAPKISPLDFRPWSNPITVSLLLGLPSVVLAKGVLHHGFFHPPRACPRASARTHFVSVTDLASPGKEAEQIRN